MKLSVRFDALARFCQLKENEIVKASDGKTFYTVRREDAEHLRFEIEENGKSEKRTTEEE